MECLNSFSFSSQGQSNFSGAEVKSWTAGAQEYWEADISLSSYFDIAGFKNVNIHGFQVIGSMQTLTAAASGGVVLEDWSIPVQINGQIPLVSGSIRTSPNQWSLDNSSAFAKIFEVGRYTNEVKFASPFQSVKDIAILGIRANGYGGQTAGNVNLYWNLNWIFYYSYEGE